MDDDDGGDDRVQLAFFSLGYPPIILVPLSMMYLFIVKYHVALNRLHLTFSKYLPKCITRTSLERLSMSL